MKTIKAEHSMDTLFKAVPRMKLRMIGEEQISEEKDDGLCRMEIRDKCLALS